MRPNLLETSGIWCLQHFKGFNNEVIYMYGVFTSGLLLSKCLSVYAGEFFK
jgi:hypothetical protein